jgi:hypothetical protein
MVDIHNSSAGADTHRESADSNAQRSATSHYGDPCLYCRASHDDVAPGPCPERVNNRAGERCDYRMSQADFDGIMEAINNARRTPLIALNIGLPTSPQEAANQAWMDLGQRLGFDGMSVRPGRDGLSFSAVSQ